MTLSNNQTYATDIVLGKLTGVDLNSTSADQAIVIGAGNKQITKILVTNPSGVTTVAAGGGLYSNF